MAGFKLRQIGPCCWEVPVQQDMRVPARFFGTRELVQDLGEEVLDQAVNVAKLPGIVRASMAMPDAHWGYGFPIGGVAAFDPLQGGIVSAGGVGFDISCGVRTLHTGLTRRDLQRVKAPLVEALYGAVQIGRAS